MSVIVFVTLAEMFSKVFLRCGFILSTGSNINTVLTNLDYKVGKARHMKGDM